MSKHFKTKRECIKWFIEYLDEIRGDCVENWREEKIYQDALKSLAFTALLRYGIIAQITVETDEELKEHYK